MTTPVELAQELERAFAERRTDVVPLTARIPEFDLAAGYVVGAELVRLRARAGCSTAGRKVGHASRAVWRKLGLETVTWAHMYEDTVRLTTSNVADIRVGGLSAPKLEPEIVFKLKHAPTGDPEDPEAVLGAVEWLALGFEIVACVYADWKFQPADFVAAYGLHAGLVVGTPLPVHPEMIPHLAAALAAVEVRLLKDGVRVAEGSGENVLKSPALCLGELAATIARQPGADPLVPGELIATGALTANQFIAPGERWTATLRGLELPDLTLRVTA